MNKKGFTLIEILAVVTIMGLLFIIAIPKISNSLNSKKKEIDTTTKTMVINAAKLYINDHHSKFEKEKGKIYCLPIVTLTKHEYLESPVKNITDDVDITNSKSVKISYDDEFKYEIVGKKECEIFIDDKYVEVNYLQSTGTQYIDTGVQDTDSIIWQTTLSIDATNGRTIMGANWGSNFSCNEGVWQVGTQNTPVTIIPDQKYNLEFERTSTSRILRVDNTETITTAPSKNYNIYFFALNETGNKASYNTFSKLYSSKIYVNGTLIRDYIPVLDLNNTPCLYDKVEGKFYYNAGTGDFLYG